MATATLRRQVTSIISQQSAAQGGRTLISSRELVTMREEITHASQLRADGQPWSDPVAVANAIHQVLRHVNEVTQGARSLPVLGGAYFPNQTFAAGAAVSFAHGLQSIVAFIPCRMRQSGSGPAPVLVEVGQDGNRISVAASAACICDVWVYPQPGPAQNAAGGLPPFPVPSSGGSGSWHTVTLNPGTANWTAPFTGTIFASWAGGGGGGTGGSGSGTATAQGGGPGGGGAQLKTYPIDVVNGTVYTLTYGAGGGGGAGGASGGANRGIGGSNGGDSLFGSLKTWAGAQGGAASCIAGDGAQGLAPGGADNKHAVLGQAGGSGIVPTQPMGWGGFAGEASYPGSDNEDGSFFGGGHGTGGFAAGGGGGGGAFGNGGAGGNAGFNTGASAAAGSSAGGGGGGGASTNAPGAGGGNGGSAGPLTIRYFA